MLTLLSIKAGYIGIEWTIMNPWAIKGLIAITVFEWAEVEEVVPLGFSSFQARLYNFKVLICVKVLPRAEFWSEGWIVKS
jgi:hypothetical protein